MARLSNARPKRDRDAGFSVVIPAYNEEHGLARVLNDLAAAVARSNQPWEILVVDDGSTDATSRVAADAGVRVLRHEFNLGYGASLKTAIRRARYDRIVITDADATYPAERILELLSGLEQADMVVAARTGARVRIPWVRRPAKWCLRRLAEYLARVPIPDINSGLRCFRRSSMEEYLHLLPSGFSFTTTLSLAFHVDARPVRYISIDYEEREGPSKIRPLSDTYAFLLLILRTVMYFDPMRVLMPPALISFLVTVGTFVYELLWEHNLAETSLVWLMITTFLFIAALLGDLVVKRGR
jgi:glycosyltransferase involved in cell wall biosynthesis